MAKTSNFFLLLVLLFINSNNKENSINPIKLNDLNEISFSFNQPIFVFEYENKIQRIYNSSINFIIKNEKEKSIKAYIYNSLDKVINDTENEFVNYLKEESLKETKNIKISYNESFYNDNSIYYLVLYNYGLTFSDLKFSVYVINSLKYLNFGNELSFKLNFISDLTFNFLIQKNHSTYLHYQTTGGGYLFRRYYSINITNEKGEIIFNKESDKTSDYIKIESNVKYFIKITIEVVSNYEIPTPEFMINYEDYKYNILLDEEKRIRKRVLSPQNFYFFKNISNLSVGETMIFKLGSTGSSQNKYVYVKYYNSDDFYSLLETFPEDKESFDYKVTISEYSRINHEIKKTQNSQKGVLFGFIIEQTDYFEIMPHDIYVECEKKEKGKTDEHDDEDDEDDREEKEDKKVDKDDESSSTPSSSLIVLIVFFVLFIIVAVFVVSITILKKRNRQMHTNNFEHLNYTPNNGNNNYNNYKNDYYDKKSNYNNVETNKETGYDCPSPPVATINGN